jgi:hypothetical protein
MAPPRPPHAGPCNTQQAGDYATCFFGVSTPSVCQEFDAGAGATCRACIESLSTDPRWGVVVRTGSSATVNLEGCLDDALGEVGLEKALDGGGSCGDLLSALYGCEAAACTSCQGSAHDACLVEAVSVCSLYDAPVESTSGPCGPLGADAAALAQSCLPNTKINDATDQEVDWLDRMITFMCGP